MGTHKVESEVNRTLPGQFRTPFVFYQHLPWAQGQTEKSPNLAGLASKGQHEGQHNPKEDDTSKDHHSSDAHPELSPP